MKKFAVLLALLGLPALAHAEDMWKWRDARGRLHYSNVQESAPPQARKVAREIGLIGGEIIGPAATFEHPGEAPAAPTVPSPTQRQRSRTEQLAGIARYADVTPFGPTCGSPWLVGQPLCPAYQADDAVAAQLWLYNAQTQLLMRRWGFSS